MSYAGYRTRRTRARRLAAIGFCVAATAYFGYHGIHGRYGLDARSKLIDRRAALAFERDGLEALRADLARDVALLSPDAPDSDLVEEIARDVLGFAYPQDRVIIAPAPGP